MSFRAATSADFAFIRSLTTDPANAPFIGDDDEGQLSASLADPAEQVLIWQPQGQPAGFAIFREIGHPTGRVELMRLALAQPGSGQGQVFVQALRDHAFQNLDARRLWLDASGENPRAIRVYLKAGFVQEGQLRAHWYRPALGRPVDQLFFGMLRDEWLAHRIALAAPLP